MTDVEDFMTDVLEQITTCFMRADTPTINGRVYSEKVLFFAIDGVQKRIKEGVFFGWSTQGNIGRLGYVSHRVTDLWMDDKGYVFAKIDVLDTPHGRELASWLRRGGIWFGLTGTGLTRYEGEPAKEMVQDGFMLQSVDVADIRLLYGD